MKTTVALAICLVILAGQLAGVEAQIDIRLSIPECSVLLNSGESADLPRDQISRLVLQVRPKTGSVRYGSIRVTLNGESGNRNMSVSGVASGYDCVIQSARGSSVPLRTGVNLIEVSLTDTWNHTHKAEFTIVIPDKTPS